MLLSSSDSFPPSFLIWIPFISFYCLIALTRIPGIMLNKSGNNKYSCLFLDLRGKAFTLSLISMILDMDFS